MNILLIFLCFFILLFIIIFIIQSTKIRKLSAKPKNRVHFYVVKDFSGELWLSLGMPLRINEHGYWESHCPSKIIASKAVFAEYGLDPKDYTKLKWRDEPIEVFLNMEN